MPLNRGWQSRIKAVEREHTAIGQAAVYFHQAALKNPGILQQGLRPREILAASKSLEGTYIIRLFAEFETGARQFWHTCRRTKPPTEILLNRLAAKCAIPSL